MKEKTQALAVIMLVCFTFNPLSPRLYYPLNQYGLLMPSLLGKLYLILQPLFFYYYIHFNLDFTLNC